MPSFSVLHLMTSRNVAYSRTELGMVEIWNIVEKIDPGLLSSIGSKRSELSTSLSVSICQEKELESPAVFSLLPISVSWNRRGSSELSSSSS